GSIYSISVFHDRTDAHDLWKIVVDVSPMVSVLRISGNQNVSNGDLQARTNINRGDRIYPEILDRSARQLTDYYHLRGFPQAQVHLVEQRTEYSDESNLLVQVTEGSICHISKIDVASSSNLVALEELKSWLGFSVHDRCDEEAARKAGRKVESQLRG